MPKFIRSLIHLYIYAIPRCLPIVHTYYSVMSIYIYVANIEIGRKSGLLSYYMRSTGLGL